MPSRIIRSVVRTPRYAQQEVFFEQQAGERRVKVLKTYDRSYAREVFSGIGDDARGALAAALELEKNYEPADIPDPNGSDYDDFCGMSCSKPHAKMYAPTQICIPSSSSPKPRQPSLKMCISRRIGRARKPTQRSSSLHPLGGAQCMR